MQATQGPPVATAPPAPPAAPAAAALRQMVFGYVVSQVVGTVARLGVADHLASGPRSVGDLAALTGADSDALRRLLQAADTVGLVDQLGDDRFAATAISECLGSTGSSFRDFAIAFTGPSHWRPIERLSDAVMTGAPTAEGALGSTVWDYFRDHPGEGASFAAAMGNLSAIDTDDVVASYDVSRFTRIVDVGGSRGLLLAGLLEANPAASGTVFDLPDIVAGAHDVLDGRGLAERVDVVAGDFFTGVPAGGDLYLLKAVLHDWDDERSLRILRNCHRADAPNATLLLVERVVAGASPLVHLADMLMLTMVGGRERTVEEFAALLDAAGFELQRTIPTPRFSLLEARRRSS